MFSTRGLFILGGGLLLLALLIFGGQYWAEKALSERLRQPTAEGDTLRFANLDFSLLRARILIDSIDISWVMDNDPNQGDQPRYRLSGRIQQIRLQGINFWRMWKDNTLEANILELSTPSLIVSQLPPDTARAEANPDTSRRALHVSLSRIDIKNGQMHWRPDLDQPSIMTLDSFYLTGSNLQVPSEENQSPYPEALSWSCRNLVYNTDDDLYQLSVDSLAGGFDDSSFVFRELKLSPRYSPEEIRDKIGTQITQLDLSVPSLRLEGFDWHALLTEQRLYANECRVEKARLIALEDQNLTKPPPTPKLLYQQKLMRLEMPVRIDSFLLRDAYIEYSLIPLGTYDKIGQLSFHHTYARIDNLTNDSAALARSPLLNLRLISDLMGAGELNMSIDAHLLADNYPFTVRGELDYLKLPQLNRMIEVATDVYITEGYISRMKFNFDANAQVAAGQMELDYENLNIKWNESSGKNNFFKALAEDIFLREDNPKEGGKKRFRRGNIYYERDPQRSFFHYFYQTFFSGLQSTSLPNLLLPKELDVKKENRKIETEGR